MFLMISLESKSWFFWQFYLSDVDEVVQKSQLTGMTKTDEKTDVLAGCSHWSEETRREEHDKKIMKKMGV